MKLKKEEPKNEDKKDESEKDKPSTTGPKPFFEETINCAFCGRPNKVSAVRETITPSVPAQRSIAVFVEKDTQTKLDEH